MNYRVTTVPPVGRELDCAKLLNLPNSVYLKCIKTFEIMEITITAVVNVNKHESHNYGETNA